jgi:ribonuclease HI
MISSSIADFIVDHSVIEEPLKFVDVQPWKLYFDGSSHKNGTGVGILIISLENIQTKLKFRLDKLCSNNEAEYEALIGGLEILLELGAKDVEIKGDSKLVVKQLTKEYICVKENLIIYFATATALLKRFDRANIQHVPRIENQEANDLAQIASGYRIPEIKFNELIKIREKLSSKKSGSDKLSIPKLGGQENQMVTFFFQVLLKFLPLTTYQTMIGEHQLSNTAKYCGKY